MTDPIPRRDSGAAVPASTYWIAGYHTDSDPPGGQPRPWAQLIVTTACSAPLSAEATLEIASKTRQGARDIVVLGPFSTPAQAGSAQERWLAAQPASPVELIARVTVVTLSGYPVHPVGVQQVLRALAPWQPVLDIGDDSPVATVTLSFVNPEITAAAGAAGIVLSAFGTAGEPVNFQTITISTPATYRTA
ncbi:hypothetical protein [Longispora albida]|uniref:hypothetical protein n=1 Tax=Longispora albida TaxID=203523 RepID=UPI000372B3FA|nr:hypothetical protein [Longispora albida]